jgi:hypothetical protein
MEAARHYRLRLDRRVKTMNPNANPNKMIDGVFLVRCTADIKTSGAKAIITERK